MGLELSSTINSEWKSSFRFPRNRQENNSVSTKDKTNSGLF